MCLERVGDALCPLTRSAPRRQSSYVQELAKKSKLFANQKRQQRAREQVQQLEEELMQLKAEEAELVKAKEAELVKAKEAELVKVQGSAGAEPAPGTELHARLRRLAEVCRP